MCPDELNKPTPSAKRSVPKRPWLASCFFPGVGQIICGDIKGGILTAICLEVLFIISLGTITGVVYPRWEWLPLWAIYFRRWGIPLMFLLAWIINIVHTVRISKANIQIKQPHAVSILAFLLAILQLCVRYYALLIVPRI